MYKTPFYKFSDLNLDGISTIYVAPDSTVYFGTTGGFIKYTPSKKLDYNLSFNTQIRKVLLNDSVLFGGSFAGAVNKPEAPEIAYKGNDIIFHFSATFYENAEKNLFSYRLIGSDTTWSAWVSDRKKEFTNLPPGEYVFEVKSKNQYQTIGTTARYVFTILYPWYRTWWAYLLYFFISQGIIWLIVKFNTHRLIKQKEKLEHIVELRTEEVVARKKEIEEKNEELNQTNEELNTTLDRLKETNEELFQTNEELSTTLDLVNVQKTQIETAHLNITDSISYAQKIQIAVLPTDE